VIISDLRNIWKAVAVTRYTEENAIILRMSKFTSYRNFGIVQHQKAGQAEKTESVTSLLPVIIYGICFAIVARSWRRWKANGN